MKQKTLTVGKGWDRKSAWVAGLMTLVLSACSDSPDLGLRDSATGTGPGQDDVELARLAEMQKIRYTRSYTCPDGTDHSDVLEQELDANQGFALFNQFVDCAAVNARFPDEDYGIWAITFRNVAHSLCSARLLREMANGARPPMVVHGTDAVSCGVVATTYTIPPLAAAANQNILKSAVNLAGFSQGQTGIGIRSTIRDNPEVLTPEKASVLSGMYLESARLYEAYFDDLLQLTVDVADAQRSSSPSLDLSTARAVTGQLLSRSEAAHLLVGGSFGLPGIDGGTLCTSSELSPRAQVALNAIRQAAPSPDDIMDDSVLTQTLVNGTLPNGSVRERLIDIYDRTIETSVEGLLELRSTDFDEARSYLRDEIRSFSRSRIMTIPPLKKANGTTPGFSRYAGVANPPLARHPSYWAAIARFLSADDFHVPNYLTAGWLAIGTSSMGLNANIDLAESTSALNAAGASVEVQDALLGPIGLLAAETQDRWVGSVRRTRGEVALRGFDFRDKSGLRALVGDDALSCAATGAIEGVPCDPNVLNNLFTGESDGGMTLCFFEERAVDIGGETVIEHVCLPASEDANTASHNQRVYLVRPKTSTSPGDFDILGGLPILPPGGPERNFVIAPHFDRRVGEILSADAGWCTQSKRTCAGADFDERMPLENELASTEDGVESSWKHYLARAKEAAQQADELGRQYIESSLDNDVRIETIEMREDRRRLEVEETLSQLQDICGTDADPIELLELLSGASGDDLASLRQKNGNQGIACGIDDDCAAGFSCIANVCLKRPMDVLAQAKDDATREALFRLEECIGPNTEEDFVTVGDTPVCIWHPEGVPSQMCSGADEKTHPCPTLKPETCGCYEACDPHKPPDITFTPVTVNATLNYFKSRDGRPEPEPTLCDGIRTLRDPNWPPGSTITRLVTRAKEVAKIRSSDMYHPWNLFQWGQRIGYRAYAGRRSAITLDGVDVYTTASCAPRDECDANNPCQQGICLPSGFCSQPETCDNLIRLGWCPNNCSTEQDWAVANDRMMKAVIALRVSTINSLERVHMPIYVKGFENRIKDVSFGAYPGAGLTPIKLSTVDAGEEPCHWPEAAGFTVLEASSSGSLPALWRDPVLGDLPRETPDGFKLAIGNVASAVPVGYTSCFNKLRTIALWQGMSTALDFGTLNGHLPATEHGAGWRGLMERSGGPPPDVEILTGQIARALVLPGSVDDKLVYQYGLPQFFEAVDDGFDLEHLVFYGPAEAARLFTDSAGALGEAFGLPVQAIPLFDGGNNPLVWGLESSGTLGEAGLTALRGDLTGALSCACSADPTGISQAVGSLFGADCDCPSDAPPAPPPLKYEIQHAGTAFENRISNYLDAAELVCNINLFYEEFHCDPENPPEIASTRDLGLAKEYLQCAGDRIERQAGLLVLPHFPVRARNTLIEQGAVGAYPAVGGDMGAAVSRLRGALEQVQRVAKDIAAQVRLVGDDIDQVRTREELAGVRDQIADVNFRSTVANYMAQCGTALASIPGLDYVAAGGRAAAAAITCANAIEQTDLAGQLRGLQNAENALGVEDALNDLRSRLHSRSDAVRGLKSELIEQLEEVYAQLAEIEKLREHARRTLSRALYQATSVAKHEAEISVAYSNRAAVSEERYRRAHRNAVRLAFLAKRAIETRLGFHLSRLHEALPLVEAPATWESTVCATSGVNYLALKDSTNFNVGQFADQFIGDYVTKLENLIESYRLAHDFHEGSDTAIVSMRDDIFNVRSMCDVPSLNMLHHSGRLDAPGNDEQEGWSVEGCATDQGASLPDCATVELLPVDSAALPFAALTEDLRKALGFHMVFGKRDGSSCAPPDCGYTPGTALVQRVAVSPGTYVLSWYYAPTAPDSPAFVDSMDIADAEGNPLPTTLIGHEPFNTPTEVPGWIRTTRSINVTEPATLLIRIGALTGGHFAIAAPQFERFEGTDTPVASPYENTGAELLHSAPACADSEGLLFKLNHWKPGCLRLCSTGFGTDCSDEAATEHCYREATFTLNQQDLESGKLFGNSGFAAGNFNYRIESIALNFVGTGIIDCSTSPTPQSCSANGNVQYTLEHAGPFIVRNNFGEDFQAALFQGNIEHARGLSLERLITNPLSETDRSLLSGYVRQELQGRPLTGTFRIRIWDDPTVKFGAIEDVQIALGYRYWTRFM